MTARAPMKPQRLTIPAPAPWINANARDHWTKKGRLTRSWRSASASWARHQKLRPVTQPVVIVATVVKTNTRRFDVENLAPTVKAAIDGLRDSGVLPEDDTRWVTEVRLRAGDPERAASLSLLIRPAHPMTTTREGDTP